MAAAAAPVLQAAKGQAGGGGSVARGSGGRGAIASSSGSSSSSGDGRIRILSSWSEASVFAGVVFTVGKSIVQPVAGDGSEWVTNTMMPAMIWVVTWMIEEGVYDDMADAGGGGGSSSSGGTAAAAAGGGGGGGAAGGGGGESSEGSGSSSGAGTAAAAAAAGGAGGGGAAGGGGGESSGGSGSSSGAGTAASAAAGGGGGGALTDEAAAAHMVVLIAVARLLLVCSEGLIALEAAEQPQLPRRVSSSGSSRPPKEYTKGKSGSSSTSSKNTTGASSSSSSSKAGLVKVGKVGGKSDAEVRCLEVFGALEADRCAFARLLGLGCYCSMKRLQQGRIVAATAATAPDGGGSSSSGQGGPAVAPSSLLSSSAAVATEAPAAAPKQGSTKASSKPAALKWSGMVMTDLPDTVVQALQAFESTQGLGFLQGLCERLVRAYQEGVQQDGVGLMLPLEDWEIFPKGYTGALLCDEVQMCAPLLAYAPYRVACNYPGCENIEGGSEASVVKKCTGCGVAAYCSRGCQTEHWPEHKETCRRLQKEQKEAAAAAAAAAGVQQLSLDA